VARAGWCGGGSGRPGWGGGRREPRGPGGSWGSRQPQYLDRGTGVSIQAPVAGASGQQQSSYEGQRGPDSPPCVLFSLHLIVSRQIWAQQQMPIAAPSGTGTLPAYRRTWGWPLSRLGIGSVASPARALYHRGEPPQALDTLDADAGAHGAPGARRQAPVERARYSPWRWSHSCRVIWA
jgi:hypothetical protein